MTSAELLSSPAQAGSSADLALLVDIGGTNIRLALSRTGADALAPFAAAKYECAGFPGPQQAIAAYLRSLGMEQPPAFVVVGAAGPVNEGRVTLTNLNWKLSEDDLHAMGFGAAQVINDYAALALAAPLLDLKEARPIGAPANLSPACATVAVVGAGTGFGVSALVRDGTGEVAASGEGGHISFAPVDELEIEILRRLTARVGRVSIERILCGGGLSDLHGLLAEIDGIATASLDSKALTAAAIAGEPRALRTVGVFCGVLGTVAGDIALAFGAKGGVFLAGGLTRGLEPLLDASPFRARFEAKGRFAAYMRAIPTRIVLRSHVGLLGAARAAQRLVIRRATTE